MKASVRIANVYDSLLEETKKDLVVVKDRKTYIGALFFRKEEWETVKKVFEKVEVEGSALDIILAAYKLRQKHGLVAKDDKSLLTMLHWQHVNGLTDEILTEQYSYDSDTAYLASLKEG